MHAKGVMNFKMHKMSVHVHTMQQTNNQHGKIKNSVHKVAIIMVGRDKTIFVGLMHESIAVIVK